MATTANEDKPMLYQLSNFHLFFFLQ